MQVDSELQNLIAILPDLTVRLDRMKADLLMKLLTNQNRIADNLLALRRVLPGLNAASLVLRYPALLIDMDAHDIEARAAALRCAPSAFQPKSFCRFQFTAPRHAAHCASTGAHGRSSRSRRGMQGEAAGGGKRGRACGSGATPAAGGRSRASGRSEAAAARQGPAGVPRGESYGARQPQTACTHSTRCVCRSSRLGRKPAACSASAPHMGGGLRWSRCCLRTAMSLLPLSTWWGLSAHALAEGCSARSRCDRAVSGGRVRPLMPVRLSVAARAQRMMDMSSQGLHTSLQDEPGLEHLPNHRRG